MHQQRILVGWKKCVKIDVWVNGGDSGCAECMLASFAKLGKLRESAAIRLALKFPLRVESRWVTWFRAKSEAYTDD